MSSNKDFQEYGELGINYSTEEKIGQDHELEHFSTIHDGDDDIDFDDEGSSEDDEEIVDARDKLRDDNLLQKSLNEENEVLSRIAARKNLNEPMGDSDYEEGLSDSDSPSESSDEDDCGYIVCPTNDKRRKRGQQYKVGTQPGEKTYLFACRFFG